MKLQIETTTAYKKPEFQLSALIKRTENTAEIRLKRNCMPILLCCTEDGINVSRTRSCNREDCNFDKSITKYVC